jgi:hypothetical protein
MSLPTLSPEGGDILFQNRPTTIRFALSGKTRALTVHWDGVVHLTLPDCLGTRFHGKMAIIFFADGQLPYGREVCTGKVYNGSEFRAAATQLRPRERVPRLESGRHH